ncbi:hypothetical protein CPSG_06691 [Coccidioides posadasii str. Silveira]|uniref:Uncharacterized protein n=1 Tax=Coccidioides posadasii (strain RMSCC 757 / Silveira) TaxID=443226 RepID=E9DA01_COCPS|nr:hypothetical protein CPSG_06691 [Coccidioides posadasii str. Silveira]
MRLMLASCPCRLAFPLPTFSRLLPALLPREDPNSPQPSRLRCLGLRALLLLPQSCKCLPRADIGLCAGGVRVLSCLHPPRLLFLQPRPVMLLLPFPLPRQDLWVL